MIVASLLLIVVAVGLLVLGMTNASSGLLVASIGTSLLAAIALVVGARQATSARVEADLLDIEDKRAESDDYEEPRERRDSALRAEPLMEQAPAQRSRQGHNDPVERPDMAVVTIPAQGTNAAPEDMDDEEDPPDEPIPQRVLPADAARIARMTTDVLVIDGRPRYHLAGCVHLLGRPHEPLPVGEAVELGFTPCGLCEPDSALLADARRV